MPNWSSSKGRSAADRGYDSAWSMLRKLVLYEERACPGIDGIYCGQPTTEVDHIQPLSTHPHLRLNRANCRALCHRHHATVTGRQGAAAKPSRKREPEQHPGVIR